MRFIPTRFEVVSSKDQIWAADWDVGLASSSVDWAKSFEACVCRPRTAVCSSMPATTARVRDSRVWGSDVVQSRPDTEANWSSDGRTDCSLIDASNGGQG